MSWLTQAFFSADRLEEFVDLEKDFEEGLVNSAIFLISMAMQLTNFAVNYHVSSTLSIPSPRHTCPWSSCVYWSLVHVQGKPFMVSLVNNKPLLICLMVTAGLVFTLASGAIPDLAASMQVIHFPEEVCCACVIPK